MAVQFIDSEKGLERVLFLFPISIGLLGLHGTYQYFTGAEMLGNWVDSTETISTRAYSIIGGPNALASVLVLNIPIALGLFIAEKDVLKRIVYIVACLFMGTGLIFTFSRAAWVAAFIAVIILFVFLARTMILPITAFLLGMVVMIETIWARISMLFTPEYYAKASDGGRIYRWTYALEKWSDTKLFGLGVGRFGGAVATNHNLSPFYMDNYYLKTMTESGIAGVTSFILLQLTTVYHMFRYIQGTVDTRYRIIMFSIFSGLIGVLLHNGVENIFESPFIVVYFWTYVGVLVAMYKIDRKRVQK
jgi:O-antigen ligase